MTRKLGRPANELPADASPLARNLRRLRESRGESLATVATAVGMNPQSGALARYERGERVPGGLALVALARHFGVSAEDLLSGPAPASP